MASLFFPAPDVARQRTTKTVTDYDDDDDDGSNGKGKIASVDRSTDSTGVAKPEGRLLPRAIGTRCLEWLDTTDLACLYVAAPHLASLVVRYYATDGAYATIPEPLASGECAMRADSAPLRSTGEQKVDGGGDDDDGGGDDGDDRRSALANLSSARTADAAAAAEGRTISVLDDHGVWRAHAPFPGAHAFGVALLAAHARRLTHLEFKNEYAVRPWVSQRRPGRRPIPKNPRARSVASDVLQAWDGFDRDDGGGDPGADDTEHELRENATRDLLVRLVAQNGATLRRVRYPWRLACAAVLVALCECPQLEYLAGDDGLGRDVFARALPRSRAAFIGDGHDRALQCAARELAGIRHLSLSCHRQHAARVSSETLRALVADAQWPLRSLALEAAPDVCAAAIATASLAASLTRLDLSIDFGASTYLVQNEAAFRDWCDAFAAQLPRLTAIADIALEVRIAGNATEDDDDDDENKDDDNDDDERRETAGQRESETAVRRGSDRLTLERESGGDDSVGDKNGGGGGGPPVEREAKSDSDGGGGNRHDGRDGDRDEKRGGACESKGLVAAAAEDDKEKSDSDSDSDSTARTEPTVPPRYCDTGDLKRTARADLRRIMQQRRDCRMQPWRSETLAAMRRRSTDSRIVDVWPPLRAPRLRTYEGEATASEFGRLLRDSPLLDDVSLHMRLPRSLGRPDRESATETRCRLALLDVRRDRAMAEAIRVDNRVDNGAGTDAGTDVGTGAVDPGGDASAETMCSPASEAALRAPASLPQRRRRMTRFETHGFVCGGHTLAAVAKRWCGLETLVTGVSVPDLRDGQRSGPTGVRDIDAIVDAAVASVLEAHRDTLRIFNLAGRGVPEPAPARWDAFGKSQGDGENDGRSDASHSASFTSPSFSASPAPLILLPRLEHLKLTHRFGREFIDRLDCPRLVSAAFRPNTRALTGTALARLAATRSLRRLAVTNDCRLEFARRTDAPSGCAPSPSGCAPSPSGCAPSPLALSPSAPLRLELSELENRPGLARLLEWFPHVTALAFTLAPETEDVRRRSAVDDDGELRFSTAAGPLAIARLRALAPTHLRHVAYLDLRQVDVGQINSPVDGEAIGGAVLDLMRALPALVAVATAAHDGSFDERARETLGIMCGERVQQLEVSRRQSRRQLRKETAP